MLNNTGRISREISEYKIRDSLIDAVVRQLLNSPLLNAFDVKGPVDFSDLRMRVDAKALFAGGHLVLSNTPRMF